MALRVGAAESVTAWLRNASAAAELAVTRIPFSQSREWLTSDSGYFVHRTGHFFRVVGVEGLRDIDGCELRQPLIDQPETGLLCFVVAREAGTWWALAQAKVEPGNHAGSAQLAPSVQATESNVARAHGGRPVPYLAQARTAQRLYSREQSEQGAAFLEKLNTNRVVCVPERFDVDQRAFQWMPLPELLDQLRRSHTVNTDARSVLSCWLLSDPAIVASDSGLPCAWLADSLGPPEPPHCAQWLQDLQERFPRRRRVVTLRELTPEWHWSDAALASPASGLSVHQVAVRCSGREVDEWDQPLISRCGHGQFVLTVSADTGKLALLLQARRDAGSRSYELTTTIHVEGGEPLSAWDQRHLEVLARESPRVLDFENADEGGRFDRCYSRYRIHSIDRRAVAESPLQRWVPLAQLSALLLESNRVTNELRSALSGLLALERLW